MLASLAATPAAGTSGAALQPHPGGKLVGGPHDSHITNGHAADSPNGGMLEVQDSAAQQASDGNPKP
jgi:hypothetical protein